MRYVECYIRQIIFVYITQSFSQTLASPTPWKNIYINIYVFMNVNLYQPQDDSHPHYKPVQVAAAEPHNIAWEPLLFLTNISSPNLELCRGRNQFWCNTTLKFLPALSWSTSPKGDQKSTIKCQRLQHSLQCLRLCYKPLIKCYFLPLLLVKLFQRSYFPLLVKQKKDFKGFLFRGEKLPTTTHLITQYIAEVAFCML